MTPSALPTMTAEQFIAATEGHLLTMLIDPAAAFQGDTARAHRIAAACGISRAEDDRYPTAIWQQVYP